MLDDLFEVQKCLLLIEIFVVCLHIFVAFNAEESVDHGYLEVYNGITRFDWNVLQKKLEYSIDRFFVHGHFMLGLKDDL